ncbi:hypothetical protein O6H91_Y052300 [Diphasiastrum complanatum]|nr:hypothetical protein O6H91_Y052300 [Diphasiastrum complanatum]
MASQRQKEKKAAAQGYDYEQDGRWAEYWSNVLVPAHLAGRPEVLQHFKLKFYQRHIDPELHVEPLSALGGSRSSTQSTTTARQESSPSTAGRQPPLNAGARNNQTGGTGGNFRRQMDQQSFKFLANAFVTLMALVATFPLAPVSISDRAYQFTLWVTAITSLYSIYLQHGKPQSWNLQGIQIWLQSVFTGKEFFYVLFALVFVTSSFPIKSKYDKPAF